MRLVLTLFVCLIYFHAYSQCPHNPTITPGNPILCPNEPDTLWTESYDSYQWYKDGNLLPNDTNQYLVIIDSIHGLTNITVEATDAGCTEMSQGVLVDAWIFNFITVLNEGDYTFVNSVFNVCLNDTITFSLSQSFDTNIQWTADGVPIAGANSGLIDVTSATPTGIVTYHVCASQSPCPNYIQCLGVNLDVQFVNCGPVGIESQVESDLSYNVYPNPSNSLITIKSPSEFLGKNYTISNQLGHTVLSGSLTSEYTKVDIREFSRGIYFIHIGNKVFKLLKE